MILMYHKIAPTSPSMWWVTVDQFYRQLCELRSKKVVYLSEYDPTDEQQFVITFDGIYENVVQFAVPLLKHFGYPFELFVSGAHIGASNDFDAVEPDAQFASKQSLKHCVANGGRLQWHSMSHPNLSLIDSAAQLEEELTVPSSIRELDAEGFSWFAYPYGEFNTQVETVVSKKFQGAVSCNQGNDLEKFRLNRLTVTNETSLGATGISVIIPSYNYGNFLPEAIESVLRQTRQANEILIVDDGSLDDTAMIGADYARRFPNLIRFVRNEENLGIVPTFNKAVEMTSGGYICFLGADNRFRADFLERTSAALDENSQLAVAYTDYALFGPRARIEYEAAAEDRRGQVLLQKYFCINFPEFTEESRQLLETGNFIHGSSLYRREAFDEAGGYLDTKSHPEDHNLFLRMIRTGWSAERVGAPLLEYRQHSSEQANQRATALAQLSHYQELTLRLDQTVESLEGSIRSLENEARQAQALRSTKRNLIERLNAKIQATKLLSKEVERLTLETGGGHNVSPDGSRAPSRSDEELRYYLSKLEAQRRYVEELERNLTSLHRSSEYRFGSRLLRVMRRLTPRNASLQRIGARLSRGLWRRLRNRKIDSVHDRAFPRFFAYFDRYASGFIGDQESGVVVNITEEQPLSVEVISEGPSLHAVEFLFGTHNRTNDSWLELRIFLLEGSSEKAVGRKRIACSEIVDNAYHRFSFDPPLVLPGEHLRLELASNAGLDNCVAVWANHYSVESWFSRYGETAGHDRGIDFLEANSGGAPIAITTPSIPNGAAESFERPETPRSPRLDESQSEQVNSEVELTNNPKLENCAFRPLFRVSQRLSPGKSRSESFEGKYFVERIARKILPGHDVFFRFNSSLGRFDEFSIQFGTHMRENDTSVLLQIYRTPNLEDSEAEVVIDTSTLNDNELARFPLSPAIVDAEGSEFLVRLSTENGSLENGVSIWGVARESELIRDAKQEPLIPIDSSDEFSDANQLMDLPWGKTLLRWQIEAKEPRQVLLLSESREDRRHNVGVSLLGSRLSGSNFRISMSSLEEFFAGELDVSEFDLVVFVEMRLHPQTRKLTQILRHLGTPLLYFTDNQALLSKAPSRLSSGAKAAESVARGFRDLALQCDAWITNQPALIPLTPDHLDCFVIEGDAVSQWTRDDFPLLARRKEERYFPKVSVISVLYAKEREIPFFLETLRRQSYQGEIELILVNDCSPDASEAAVRDFYTHHESDEALPALTVLRNDENIGNCGSRNRGIEEASGEILIVIDADHLLNEDFVQAHVEAHAVGDCSCVVGPYNLETGDRDPYSALEEYELSPALALEEAELQEPTHLESFLNCITRNFSIKRSALPSNEPLFDESFAYSASKDSGFGWEDVEMGYRLFDAGERMKFIERAFAIHISHPPSIKSSDKPLRSLSNFRKLVEKHPAIILAAPRWCSETFDKILTWAASNDLEPAEDKDYLSKAFSNCPPLRHSAPKASKRGLRVLTYRWHCPHQYELYHLPHDFTLLRGLGTGFTNHWEFDQRVFPDNARFCNVGEVDPADFDLAIMHFDENVLRPELTSGVISPDWGLNFRWFLNNVDIPKVAICHGTPQFVGQYNGEYTADDLGRIIEQSRHELVEALRDVFVITNSFEAEEQWHFHRAKTIWHGMDPSEYPISQFKRGILSLGEPIRNRPHYRGYGIYEAVCSELDLVDRPQVLQVDSPDLSYIGGTNPYARAKFHNFISAIRNYSIYFNPTVRSPMPRSRTDAMLCGLATVSYDSHDVSSFIRNGHNGFYSKSVRELSDYLKWLLKNPDKATAIGLRGRETAMRVFNRERFLDEWQQVISEVL